MFGELFACALAGMHTAYAARKASAIGRNGRFMMQVHPAELDMCLEVRLASFPPLSMLQVAACARSPPPLGCTPVAAAAAAGLVDALAAAGLVDALAAAGLAHALAAAGSVKRRKGRLLTSAHPA